MRGKRSARSRSRGSWAPRLVGTGFALLLAVAGVAAYLIVGRAHGRKDTSVLPTRVVSTQAVGIVNTGLASQTAPETLRASPASAAACSRPAALSRTGQAGCRGARTPARPAGRRSCR